MNNTMIAIDVERLREMMDNGEPVTVLDVRPTDERQEWSIPGSVHVDAYRALNEGDPGALEGIDLPDDEPIVTVCAAGRTSLLAALHLREQGYDALSLSRGMQSWSNSWNVATVPIADPDVSVLQVRRTGKGCLSYMVASEGEAAVIDAALDPEIYMQIARESGWRISAVLDTHIHADHLSRSRLLADRAGGDLYLPDQNRSAFPFTPVRDQDQIAIGAIHLTAIHTPGHTLESTSYLLGDQAVFTGDTLFLDGVGRPDLEADIDEAGRRASLLYDSVARLLELPGQMLVLPGHTAIQIPFDGESIDLPIGEVARNLTVMSRDKAEFIEWILGRIPPTPPNHSLIVQLNESGMLPGVLNQTDLEAGANRCAIS